MASPRLNPDAFSFAGQNYDVKCSSPKSRSTCSPFLGASGEEIVLENGALLIWDFNHDGLDDIAIFQDERDGFRNTFCYLSIYVNGSIPLGKVKPILAKFKDDRWIMVDQEKFPDLEVQTVAGKLFRFWLGI